VILFDIPCIAYGHNQLPVYINFRVGVKIVVTSLETILLRAKRFAVKIDSFNAARQVCHKYRPHCISLP
jgi:hypothetical protein